MSTETIETAAREIYNLVADHETSHWSECGEATRMEMLTVARAVIAAIHPTVSSEWGIQSGDHVLTSPTREQAEAHSASCTASTDSGKTWFNTHPPVMSRQVTEWAEVNAKGGAA